MRVRLMLAASIAAGFIPGCSSRPWTFAVLLGDSPMVIRVHDGNESWEWLVPGNAEQDLVYLNVEPRPTGPIELIEPGTCRIVATASPARTGPGVLLNYWFDGDADRWVFKADVDTLLEPPRAPLASGSFCGGANATLRDAD